MRRSAYVGFLGLLVSVAGCGAPVVTKQCMMVGASSDLVAHAAALRLDVYEAGTPCNGATVGGGAAPLLSHTFLQGEPVKLDVPPGKRTLLLTAFSDRAATQLAGSGG